jgi:hypothetical protein
MIKSATNKKLLVIITITLVSTLFGGIAIAELASNSQTAEDLDNTKVTNQTEPSLYEKAYAKATSEQKAELDKIIADKGVGLPGEWIRPVLIAIGDLPKDQPRLTAKQAGDIYDRIGTDGRALESEFNKIAGAPDFVGGSGIGRYIYYLNENRTDAIYVFDFDAHHVVFNADGTQTTLPIGNQQLPVNPGPSTSPQGIPQRHPVQPTPTEMPLP